MAGPRQLLAELSWEEVAARRPGQPVVLLPVGATEAHGPHLPLGTDVMLSEELAARAQQQLQQLGVETLIAPSLAYAVAEFGAPFCGNVSIRPDTAAALVADVCEGLHRGGLERVCLVNSHLEPAHVAALRQGIAEAMRRTGATVALADPTERRWARTLSEEYRRGDCHAGRYETALLLAARPELVRGAAELPANPARFLAAVRGGARTFVEAGGPRAYFGDPAAATAQEGEQLFALLVQMVVQTVLETWPPDRPAG
ncbi:MAG: creatininase family protein [Myxococcales bacterium]|nr:creatininase family protein [Myxococcota bacterium]MDW8284067.1 creatininase family protein [Myxococcales bacterium]